MKKESIPLENASKILGKAGQAIAHAGSDALSVMGLVGGAAVLSPVVVAIGPILLIMSAMEKANELLETQLSRVAFKRLDRIEQAADSAGVSRAEAVVGISQKYIHSDSWGAYAQKERMSLPLARLDEWRDERGGRRKGLWISKADEREAIEQIKARAPKSS